MDNVSVLSVLMSPELFYSLEMRVVLFLGIFILTSTAEATKPIGMFHPKKIHSSMHSKRVDRCDLMSHESMGIHAFSVSIDCSYQCKKDQKEQSVTLSKYFDPEKEDLKRGDGYHPQHSPMMTAFTTVFFTWSSKECLDESIRRCGSIQDVTAADFKKISSGNWSMSEKPSCKQNDRVLFSPYDHQFALNTSKKFMELSPQTPLNIPRGEPIIQKKGEKNTPCRFPIRGSVCFGDCILYDDHGPSKQETPITLMTKESPVADREEKVCGDSLLEEFKGKNLSPAVAESICQDFYMNSLVKAKIVGTTCAAFRGLADCSAFKKKILR